MSIQIPKNSGIPKTERNDLLLWIGLDLAQIDDPPDGVARPLGHLGDGNGLPFPSGT